MGLNSLTFGKKAEAPLPIQRAQGSSLTIPGRAGVSQLLGDDALLKAEVHQPLQDAVGKWHIQADVSELIIHPLEALRARSGGVEKGITSQRRFQEMG